MMILGIPVFYSELAEHVHETPRKVHKRKRWMTAGQHNRMQKKWNKKYGMNTVRVPGLILSKDPGNGGTIFFLHPSLKEKFEKATQVQTEVEYHVGAVIGRQLSETHQVAEVVLPRRAYASPLLGAPYGPVEPSDKSPYAALIERIITVPDQGTNSSTAYTGPSGLTAEKLLDSMKRMKEVLEQNVQIHGDNMIRFYECGLNDIYYGKKK